MVIVSCSESSPPNTSHRISFSLYIHKTNPNLLDNTIPSSSSQLDSFSGFNFFFENRIQTELSSANELFSQGLIRPKEVEQKNSTLSRQSSLPNPKEVLSIRNCTGYEYSKVEKSTKENVIASEAKSESKSFWRMKRSSSLRCENSYKKSSFWSLPLLSRSNSTGSVPYTKLKSSKDNHSSAQTMFSTSSSSHKPPSKKINRLIYKSNKVRVGHILSVPAPIISPNLFGFSSFFSKGKEKKAGGNDSN